MEVGRTRIPIRNLLQLNQGSVVELDRAAGNRSMCSSARWWRGEVVVVNEVRHPHLDVVSRERIRKLK
jgi:flagellar motor switch protein FliN/FliY